MNVALVSTWDIPCGIAEMAAYLKAAVEAADPTITLVPITNLHPAAILAPEAIGAPQGWDVILLNYQAALLSQWHPEDIRAVQVHGMKVLVVWHDSGVPNSDQAKGVCAAADSFVVHEPYDDLDGNGRYWRMGVPDWQLAQPVDIHPRSWCGPRPILGSIGFPYPWKCLDELARVTAKAGWALLLIAPTATPTQVATWTSLNPHLCVYNRFLDREEALQLLGGCDATAFCFSCANTGQSGSILQGIAARKPVIAFSHCRQMKSLWEDPLGREVIYWTDSFDGVAEHLRTLPIQRVDPGTVALATQDSWEQLGRKYAALLHELVR